jgi:hypothetical protein
MNAIAAATQQATAMTVDNVQPAQEKINMNAIVNMYKNTSDMSALRNEGHGSADFEIDEKILVYFSSHHGHLDSSKKVIYRTDTGTELGVLGLDYHAVPPKKMIDTTRAIIERSNLDTTGIEETIRTSHNGARTFVQYRLPAHSYTTPDGDTASLGLLAVSSFDGTWPFMISAAAVQAACTNLQVFVGGEVAVFKSKHTKNLNIEIGSRVIVKALDVFENQRELWSKWTKQSMTDFMVFQEIVEALDIKSAQKIIDGSHTTSGTIVMEVMPRRNPDLEYIYSKYLGTYKNRLGNNRWAFYNAMTDWSTHAPQRKSKTHSMASVRSQRQDKIATYFTKMAA